MATVGDPGLDFDLAAAGLRADGGDLRISLEALATKLQEALPAATRVQRSGGGLLRRGSTRVSELKVELGAVHYQLAVTGERLSCSRERQVGGIAIKREPLDPADWVAALAADLQVEAERSSGAREALARLLA